MNSESNNNCSSSSNNNMTSTLDAIRAKLARGADLQAKDLQSLQTLHDVISVDETETTTVPYLDRSFLLNSTSSATTTTTTTTSGRLPQLVRYVGMVQDMMDPEYYPCKDSKGRSTHFSDGVFEETAKDNEVDQHDDKMQEDECHDLAERIPLVVVPIPFASEWLLQGLHPEEVNNTNTSSSSPKSVAHSFDARKRARDEEEMETSSSDNRKREKGDDVAMEDGTSGDATTTTTSNRNDDKTQPNDWWPAGMCGSSEGECPVLAKFCYEQLLQPPPEQQNNQHHPHHRRLMLNDIVSMVGVLSVNPWEADFSKQQPPQQQPDEWMGGDWGGDDDFSPCLPPPSLLPRLHVLSYQKLDLDELAQRAVREMTKAPTQDMDTTTESRVEATTLPTPSSCPEALFSLFDTQSNPKETHQLAQALWMCLVSKADRRSTSGKGNEDRHLEILRAGPMERALGCLSLQLSMPDIDRSRSLFHHLATNVLPATCPVVASIDFTKKEDISLLGTGPGKSSNCRLKPCSLQLPAGSVLLVHYHPKSSPATEAGTAAAIQGSLYELVKHHRIPYRFEGDVVIPFEADYRVIVVTTQTDQLPCTLSVLCKDRISASTLENDDVHPKLQEMLCLARSDNNLTGAKLDVKLSASLMERAQQDFMSRRRDAYESKTQQQQISGLSTSSSLPGEDDFHRWLTLTKIQARTRCCAEADANEDIEATVEDWEIALKLDDASQKGMVVV